jgi:nicotinate-nucleotide adenylyltransferase
MPSAKKIGLFGGSFDPPHWGHLMIALRAMESVGLKQVIFIPCRQSPLKTHQAYAKAEDRLRMLELATEDLDWAEIADLELRRDGPSYTADTIRELQATHPGSLYWIMGADQWGLLEDWREYDLLIEKLKFIVYPREEQVVDRPGVHMHQINYRFDISSTEIRKRIEQGLDIRCFTSEAVADYIRKNRLYQS